MHFAICLAKSSISALFSAVLQKMQDKYAAYKKTMLNAKNFFEKPLDNFSSANYIIIFDNKGKRRLTFCF